MKTFFLGLFTGYPLALLLYVYLWMMGRIKTDPSSRKVMTTQARHILLFCTAMCLLLFLISYGMSVYSTGIIRQAQVNSVGLTRKWGDWWIQFHFYRNQIIQAAVFFLLLWPPLTTTLICSYDIRKYRFLFLLAPIFFAFFKELVGKSLYLWLAWPREIELYYIFLLKPVFKGYALALLLLAYFFIIKKSALSKS